MNASSPPPDPATGSCSQQVIRLFLEPGRELLRYVVVLVPNVADARDVVQETAVAPWDKIEFHDRKESFAPWACRYALYDAWMFLRKQRRRDRLAEDVVELLQEQRIVSASRLEARRDHLRDCLGGLPERSSSRARALGDFSFWSRNGMWRVSCSREKTWNLFMGYPSLYPSGRRAFTTAKGNSQHA